MLKEKIKSLSALSGIIKKKQKAGKKIVFTNGCFDILHRGHAQYLEAAAKKGDLLVVGVNSDSSVRKIKGRNRPIVSGQDRAGLVAALKSVDFVVIFKETTPLKVIKALKPDVIVKGADWSPENIVGAKFVKSYGGKVLTIKLLAGRSTTALIKKIAKIF